jgi:photosystem II stability/assembly factor-like uncharacterized protein
MKQLVLILLFASCILHPASAQLAGWNWQNPYLQGNDLNSILMNGVVGWAVGDLGTVLHTVNSGYDWEMVDLKTSVNLNSIYMNEITGDAWIVGDNGTIFYSDDSGVTWSKQYSGTQKDLYSISAIEGVCPWICGNDVILTSIDHGENWQMIACPFHTWFWEISQKDCNEAWVCGNEGLLISTKDRGATWQSHSAPTTFTLLGIDVVPNGDYRACGNQAVIIRSSDGGETWVKENQTAFINMNAIETRGIGGPAYAVGDKGHILETVDGGTSWTDKASPTIYQLKDVCFQALYHAVYAVGWYGQVVKKDEDAGAFFEVMNKKPNHWMMDMDFINENTGWVAGGESMDDSGTKEGVILHTTDGGKTWVNQQTKPYFFNSIDFVNENEGWVVGGSGVSQDEGVILHTMTGGTTWTKQDNPIIGSIDKVFFLDENNGWVASNDWWGQIAHTSDGGSTWVLQTNPTKNPIVDVFFINPLKGWAVGMDSTILRTTDGGQTWSRVDLTVTNNWYFRSVYFIDEMHGWTVGVYGIIMLTNDGGLTWQEVRNDYGESLQSVFFLDMKNGWAVGDAGTILRTIDGGYTWFNQYSGVSRNFLASVSFLNKNVGWVTGEGGTIKHTENGGFWNEPGVFLRNNRNLAIKDLSETRDTLLADFSDMKRSGYQMVGLEVMIDSIIHSKASDLEISLSHLGVSQTLVTQVADTGANFLWLRLTDDASTLVTEGIAPFSGNHKPVQPLTVFNGLDPEGEWILAVKDKTPGNTGVLKAWGIKPHFERLVSIAEKPATDIGSSIQLNQNTPNPFSGSTTIHWSSSASGFTTLKVFTASGIEIETLTSKYLPKGDYTIQFDRTDLDPGVYYYQLMINGHQVTKKLIIL